MSLFHCPQCGLMSNGDQLDIKTCWACEDAPLMVPGPSKEFKIKAYAAVKELLTNSYLLDVCQN